MALSYLMSLQHVAVGCFLCKEDDCEEGEIKEMDDDDSPYSDDRPHVERALSPPSICRFYLRGTCTWGGNCRFHHPGTCITQLSADLLL